MFRRHPILTAGYCEKLEKLRITIEVLEGYQALLIHIDFNRRHAKFRLIAPGPAHEIDVVFLDFYTNDLAQIGIKSTNVLMDLKDYAWYTARFDFDPHEIRVISDNKPVKKGPQGMHSMWWVGCSYKDRRLEPLEPKNVECCAKKHGLSVEEYLKLR